MENNSAVLISEREASEYIKNLKLPEIAPARISRSTSAMKNPIVENNKAASIVASNAVAFVGELSEQSMEDVQHSLLLATLGADFAFSKDRRQEVWYESYTKTLKIVGWAFPSHANNLSTSMHQNLTMDHLALKLLASIATNTLVPALTPAIVKGAAVEVFKALESQKGPFTLFTKHASSDAGSGFQTGVCVQAKNGAVHMTMGCLRYSAAVSQTKVLFWKWASGTVETFTAAATVSLSKTIYAARRAEVLEKLGVHATQYIANLELGDLEV